MTMQDIWDIDCHTMFNSFKNFFLFHKSDDGPFGGLVFGRPSTKQIVQVIFVNSDSMNAATIEFITSSLSADLEHVGNLVVEGHNLPMIGDGFVLNTTQEALERNSVSEFLDRNGMLNSTRFNNDGLSVWAKIGFECNIRKKKESDDLKINAERFISDLDRLVFINQSKGIILRNVPEKDIVRNVVRDIAKGSSQYKDSLGFTTLHNLTRNTSNDKEDQKMVPIVRITRDGTEFEKLSTLFTVVVPAFSEDDSNTLYKRFQEGVRRRIQNLVYTLINGFKKQKADQATLSTVFYPPGWTTLLHLQMPQWTDEEQRTYRIKLHKLFNLPTAVPCLRLAQQIPFGGAASTKLLRSPHLSIVNYKPYGKVSVLSGPYNYHHYMQDNFDDSGWGCAYRSLQTIWSWFALNGYTDKPVPNHREIQQCLVNIGDKQEKFVGSKQWIGSTEIGFVLDTLLGVESKFIITNSGAEVAERARELSFHFDTAGTPVMIGGGQLAHTILGVDFDENTGDCRFLVLDPHFTGEEDLRKIINKYCAWMPATFWKADYFYNMVLPQPPSNAI
ncbi:unnamed protein product [Auanema sp. JU1783]|nr:unnamed protein product [Auanema sp. JU1783]